MKQIIFLALSLAFCFAGSSLQFSSASAQVTPDGTTSTKVVPDGNGNFEINDGDRAGDNLFHSFQEFSVPTGGEAFFNNVGAIENIFSRVTGGNISNIDGLIRALGSANLFLLNPAGIIFGEGASLDIGGSFYASTADSIVFPDGEFSATDVDNPPLLSVNIPYGFNLRDNSADIINRSRATANEESSVEESDEFDFDFGFIDGEIPVGLQVEEGQAITLEAGNIHFEGGLAAAPGGSITLKATGDIEITSTNITDQSINTSLDLGDGGKINLNSSEGSITITNSNLSSDSSFETSNIGSGGNVTFTADKSVLLTNSFISSTTTSLEGRGGNVIINAGSSITLEDTRIDAANFGDGRSGDITLEALNGGTVELIGTQVEAIDFLVDVTELESAGVIFVEAFGSGEGLADGQTGGELTIKGGSIMIDNYNLFSRVNAFSDDPFLPNENTQGNAGDISITGDSSIVIKNNSSLVSGTLGDGNAGNINLNASNIKLTDGVELNTQTQSQGAAGIIEIDSDSLILDSSSIDASNTPPELVSGELSGGNINLNLTGNLFLQNESTISAEANNNANGGNIDIKADFIIASPNQNNDIIANAEEGNGGNIDITAESLFGIEERSPTPLTNDINASSEFGLDGNITINTPEVDPSSGLIELPQAVGDASDQISQNSCEQGVGSEFIITGKGGFPSNPYETLNRDEVRVGLVEPVSSRQRDRDTGRREEEFRVGANAIHPENPTPEAVPAQGWIFNDKGEVMLTAYKTTETEINRSSGQTSKSCSVF